jgi:hypothetical protein
MMTIALREILTNAIRYWERARTIYNVVLVAIVLAYFAANWPASANRLTADVAEGLFLLAVPSNVAYCAAYVPDTLAQLSDLRPTWIRYRWILFVIGVAFAAILTRFVARGMFGNAGPNL